MKPNAEQQQFIKAQLQDMLKVRETYEELYDHVLTALEVMPDGVPFYDAVHHIIEHDLGGKNDIRSMQTRAIKIAIKDFIKDYFICLGQSLTSALMLIIIAVTVIFYLLMKAGVIGHQLIYLIIPMGIASRGLRIVRKKEMDWQVLKIDYAMFRIRSFASTFVPVFPMFLWLLTSVICSYLQNKGIMAEEPGPYHMTTNIGTAIFFIALLNSLTYYKLYKDYQITTT
jgi:hypothetical protein